MEFESLNENNIIQIYTSLKAFGNNLKKKRKKKKGIAEDHLDLKDLKVSKENQVLLCQSLLKVWRCN